VEKFDERGIDKLKKIGGPKVALSVPFLTRSRGPPKEVGGGGWPLRLPQYSSSVLTYPHRSHTIFKQHSIQGYKSNG